jgi:hypothetical protein
MEEEYCAAGLTSVFTAGSIAHAEPVMSQIGYGLSRQSDRSLPRTYFRSGYIPNRSRNDKSRSSLKRSGQEVPGIVLVVLIFLLMTETPGIQKIFKSIGGHRTQNWIKLLETLLLFENWLKSNTLSRPDVTLVGTHFIPWFVDFFKRVVRRLIGEGLDIPKVHLNFHIWKDILRLAVPINFTGHFAESNLKYNGKNWGKLTQMRSHSIDNQTAERSREASIIRLAKAEVDYINTGRWGFFFGPTARSESPNKHKRNGLSIVCTFSPKRTEEDDTRLQASYRTRKRDQSDFPPATRVQGRWTSQELTFDAFSECVTNLLFPLATDKRIDFFTEFESNTIIFRANPLQKDRAWQDFAMVATTTGGEARNIPVHLLILFHTDTHLPEGQRQIPCLTDDGVISPGDYALVHYFEEDPFCATRTKEVYDNDDDDYRIDGNCSLVRWQCKSTPALDSGELPRSNQRNARRYVPRLAVVSLKKIVDPCIAIPDKHSVYPNLWMFVMPRRKWKEAFLTLINGEMRDVMSAHREEDTSSEEGEGTDPSSSSDYESDFSD